MGYIVDPDPTKIVNKPYHVLGTPGARQVRALAEAEDKKVTGSGRDVYRRLQSRSDGQEHVVNHIAWNGARSQAWYVKTFSNNVTVFYTVFPDGSVRYDGWMWNHEIYQHHKNLHHFVDGYVVPDTAIHQGPAPQGS